MNFKAIVSFLVMALVATSVSGRTGQGAVQVVSVLGPTLFYRAVHRSPRLSNNPLLDVAVAKAIKIDDNTCSACLVATRVMVRTLQQQHAHITLPRLHMCPL